jgi:NADH-ubiquinone oxidoreductase chain 4
MPQAKKNNMIISLLIVPLIGILLLLPIGANSLKSKSKMKKIALSTSLLNLLISVILWFQFDFNSTTYQFVYEFNQLNFCHFNIGIDGISLYFILLTTFITPFCILSN